MTLVRHKLAREKDVSTLDATSVRASCAIAQNPLS